MKKISLEEAKILLRKKELEIELTEEEKTAIFREREKDFRMEDIEYFIDNEIEEEELYKEGGHNKLTRKLYRMAKNSQEKEKFVKKLYDLTIRCYDHWDEDSFLTCMSKVYKELEGDD